MGKKSKNYLNLFIFFLIVFYPIKSSASTLKCDLFIVIGAKNSSNSLRLLEVSQQYGAKESILVEKIEKFDFDNLRDISSIGITASASAPEILVQNFIKSISD